MSPSVATEPALKAVALTKRYGALQVLSNVDFELGPDEAVGVVGPNGAGKTTLLSLLVGAQPPTSGQVFFRGSDVSNVAIAKRCGMGLVRTHQVPRPFLGMSVFENVYVAAAHGGKAKNPEAYDRVIEALRLTGMIRIANRKAESIGLMDRKRLELARALATGPAVLLLDEIGGGLTDGEALELVDIIASLRRRGVAIVWIEHIVHILVRIVTRLVCMDAGQVIANGEPREVLANPAVVKAYLGGGVA